VNVLVHAIDGRLRVRIPAIKRNAGAAVSLEQSLRRVRGVKGVRANPLTGSVLIHYDPWRIGQGELLELFGVSGEENQGSPQRKGTGVARSIADVVVPIVFEAVCYFAVRRLLALPLRSL
jgi:heavy-metal-associated domain-containing protein